MSRSEPNGNTTGVSILADEADGKRQDILIEAVPGLRLMAVLVDVNDTKNPAKLAALQEAARAHNVEFSIHRVARAEEIAAAIDSAQANVAPHRKFLEFFEHRPLSCFIDDAASSQHVPPRNIPPERSSQSTSTRRPTFLNLRFWTDSARLDVLWGALPRKFRSGLWPAQDTLFRRIGWNA